ncbi:MAG: hypothetical protein Fur0043_25700 [Anaerolineales bacterium]
MQEHGIAVRVYGTSELQDVEPAAREDVVGGVHFTGDAHLDPARFLGGLAERVRAMGAQVFEHTPVTGFLSAGGKVQAVKTGQGEIEAGQFVLAAGAWSGMLARKAGLHIPLQPARGYSLTASAVQHMPSHALILGDRRVAVTPLGKRLRVTGRLEVGEFDTTPNLRWIQRLEGFAREYLRLETALEIEETWAGLRPTTPDGMPIIGFSPRHSNFILATGHAMLGLSLGPGTGQVVAELANGVAPAAELRALGYRYR